MSTRVNSLIFLCAAKGVAAAVFMLAGVGQAEAHAAEQGLILLLPTDIYIAAGVSTFILTVILVNLLPAVLTNTIFNSITVIKIRACPNITVATSVCSTIFLFFLIYIGLAGPRNPQANLLPLVFWSGWWIGLLVIQGLLGNLWGWVNPWTGLSALLDAALKTQQLLKLPTALGAWPAVVIFILFSVFALADPAPADPERLAQIVFGYWLFTFVGMLIFGAHSWGRQVECFTILFCLISKLSPLQIGNEVRVGLPGWALFLELKWPASIAMFCLVFLGAGSFDGLSETFWWLAIINVNPLEFPGKSALITETITGLLISIILLCLVFLASIYLGAYFAKSGAEHGRHKLFSTMFTRQALSLLPIGLGFHLAHFLPTFLIQMQYTMAALTDPFGTGADYLFLGKINIYVGFLSEANSVRWLWLSQAGIIVLSHVFAVLIVHNTSRKLYPNRQKALLAELPLTVFMVFYTIFGLWLLASPRGT